MVVSQPGHWNVSVPVRVCYTSHNMIAPKTPSQCNFTRPDACQRMLLFNMSNAVYPRITLSLESPCPLNHSQPWEVSSVHGMLL